LFVIGAAGLLLALVNVSGAPPALAGSCSTSIELVSRASDGTPANGDSEAPAVDGDGCIVAFKSQASNLASGTNTQYNVFVRNRSIGTTTRIPPAPEPDGGSYPPALNACVAACGADNDGEVVAFASAANNLLPEPTPADYNSNPDVFVFDQSSGRLEPLTFADIQGNEVEGGGGADTDEPPSLSADGNLVAFTSSALHLEGSTVDNTNGHRQVYVHYRTSGSKTLVSVVTVGAGAGGPALGDCAGAAISGDGCVVAFYSAAGTLVGGYTSHFTDVFARDLCADPQTTELVSVPISGATTNGPSQAWPPSLSYDGRFVAFASDASNLVEDDDNNTTDVFVRDRLLGVTLRISQGENAPSRHPSISADGRFVAFQSTVFNAVLGKDIFVVFVVDITDGIVRPAVPISMPLSGGDPDGNSIYPQISGDGLMIVFQSTATNLVSDSANGAYQIFAAPNPPTPTFTGTASPTDTETPTPTNTAPTDTPTSTATPPTTTTPTATITPAPSWTSSPALTSTPTIMPTSTPTPTVAPSFTPTATQTLTPTTPAGVSSATPTPSGTAVRTATPTPTVSQTPTPTSGGGGGAGGGGGGGCSCGIDPGASVRANPSVIVALAFPLVLRLLRDRRRR
jgi:hypothetical protein